MSAHKALSAYFMLKKIEDNAKIVESVYAYGNQVKKKKKGDSEWDTLKQDTKNSKVITKAGKGVLGALKVFKKSVSVRPEWPKGNRLKYFEWLAKTATFYGPTSDEAKEDRHYVLISENNYYQGVASLLKEYEKRLTKIQKHIKLAKAQAKYAYLIEKTFLDLTKLPSVVPGTGAQAEWFTIAQNALQHAGICNEIVSVLSKLETSHLKAVKGYKAYLKIDNSSHGLYTKILKSDDPADFDKYRKILKKLESCRLRLKY